LLSALLAGAIGYLVSSNVAPTYRAEARYIVGPINADATELEAYGSLARTYAELGVSRPVLENAIDGVGVELTVLELRKKLSASANDVTRILTIDVRDEDPGVAAGLANTVGRRLEELSERESAQNASRLEDFAREAAVGSLSEEEGDEVLSAARRLVGDSRLGRLAVVQRADPDGPPEGGTVLAVILATFAGGVVAAVIALFAESRSKGIDDEAALPDLSGVSHLGRVDAPRGRSWRQRLPAWTVPDGPAAERYRLLAFKIGVLERRERLSLVLLDAGEGQTSGVVAGNLAACISRAGWRVLVVDADTTGAGLTRMFRLEGARGYTDLLAELDGREAKGHIERLFPRGDEPLDVLPLGTSPTNDILDVEQLEQLVEHLQKLADVILITAPPTHRSPAGLMWARVADEVLLALDDGRTSRHEVKDTLQSLAGAGATIMGTVMVQRGPAAGLLRRSRGISSAFRVPGGSDSPSRTDGDGRQ
jgi:Mrp family chromosome partitioning ATPase/capsular polysaccharide biosynthesis protein